VTSVVSRLRGFFPLRFLACLLIGPTSFGEASQSETALQQLASELVSSRSDAERRKRIEAAPQLLTPDLVRILVEKGFDFIEQGRNDQALKVQDTAREIAGQIGDLKGAVDALRGTGGVYYSMREYSAALEWFQRSLSAAEKCDCLLGKIKALDSIGNSQYALGNFQAATDAFQETIRLADLDGDVEHAEMARGGLALIYEQQGRVEEALQIQLGSLRYWQKIGDQSGTIVALGNIGNIYTLQGNHAVALEFYNRCLQLIETTGLRSWLPNVLNTIGTVILAQGNHIEPLQQFYRSIQIAHELGARNLAADAERSVAEIHLRQGNEEQALASYRKTLAMYRQIGSLVDEADVLASIGKVMARQGNHGGAQQLFQQALRIYRKLNNQHGLAQTLENQAEAYALQGKYLLARGLYEQAENRYQQTKNRAGIARVVQRIGRIEYGMKNYARALDLAARAASIAEDIDLLEVLVEARQTIADSQRAQGQQEDARQLYESTIATVEQMRSHAAGGEQDRERFLERTIAPYYALIDLLVEMDRSGDALHFAERAKARLLLDVLRNGRGSVSEVMTEAERREEERLLAEMTAVSTQLARGRDKGGASSELTSSLKEKLQRARLAYESFETTLYAAHPEVRAQRGEVTPPNSTQINQLLQQGRRAVFEFVVGEKRSVLFALTRSSGPEGALNLRVYALQITSQELQRKIADLRALLSKPNLSYREQARRLYRLLLGPAAEQLRETAELCIVPDGALWELPFQALVDEGGHFLVESHSIFYAPSLAVLQQMVDTERKQIPFTDDSRRLLAFGNPLVGSEAAGRLQAVYRGELLLPLQDAEQEVNALSELYGADRSAIYTRGEAREETAKEQLPNYRILHFATHGVIDDRNPLYSHLVLAQAPPGSKEDGLLEAWEVMRMQLRAEIAILSACQTAQGRIDAGEGVIGISWAFFIAGVPTVLASQWKVDSQSTRDLMIAFHRKLANHQLHPVRKTSKADLLRFAQLEMIQNRHLHHPYHWAGFIIVGDGT